MRVLRQGTDLLRRRVELDPALPRLGEADQLIVGVAAAPQTNPTGVAERQRQHAPLARRARGRLRGLALRGLLVELPPDGPQPGLALRLGLASCFGFAFGFGAGFGLDPFGLGTARGLDPFSLDACGLALLRLEIGGGETFGFGAGFGLDPFGLGTARGLDACGLALLRLEFGGGETFGLGTALGLDACGLALLRLEFGGGATFGFGAGFGLDPLGLGTALDLDSLGLDACGLALHRLQFCGGEAFSLDPLGFGALHCLIDRVLRRRRLRDRLPCRRNGSLHGDRLGWGRRGGGCRFGSLHGHGLRDRRGRYHGPRRLQPGFAALARRDGRGRSGRCDRVRDELGRPGAGGRRGRFRGLGCEHLRRGGRAEDDEQFTDRLAPVAPRRAQPRKAEFVTLQLQAEQRGMDEQRQQQ
ncbi:MAG: hypothetical protein KDF63_00305 [Rhodoferax sp.]|nr:hypothetical protein [Rhodoferax sp.]